MTTQDDLEILARIKAHPGLRERFEAILDIPENKSGEIESSHRYVIQKRLKIARAWWKPETAEHMLCLRTLRANEDWE